VIGKILLSAAGYILLVLALIISVAALEGRRR
jgi:hypothetical protein